MTKQRMVRLALLIVGAAVMWCLFNVPLGRAQDTSYLACPSFTKDATGKMVRTTSCTYNVKAPSSPGVDMVCARALGATVDLQCISAKADQTVSIKLSPATPGKGHVVFQVYAVDADANLGTGTPSRIESGPSDRSGILVDLDLAQILQVIIDSTPASGS